MGPQAFSGVNGSAESITPVPSRSGELSGSRARRRSGRPARTREILSRDHSEETPDARGIYIQQASHLVGATAAQLRMWEQQQLISPARTRSGYRMYSMSDIERMRRIQALTATGVNAAGIRRILDGATASAHSGDAAVVSPPHTVGQTVRGLRKRAGLSLRDVSEVTGLSASYISSIERGAAAPSIASLQKLGAAFDTNAISLMDGSYAAPNSLVVRAGERRVLDSDHGVRIEDLSTSGSNLEPLIFTFQPGCGSEGAISHEGEEFLLVLAGQLHLCLDGSDEYLLDRGDSMSFRSERAHQFGNPGDSPTTVLWINTPRTF